MVGSGVVSLCIIIFQRVWWRAAGLCGRSARAGSLGSLPYTLRSVRCSSIVIAIHLPVFKGLFGKIMVITSWYYYNRFFKLISTQNSLSYEKTSFFSYNLIIFVYKYKGIRYVIIFSFFIARCDQPIRHFTSLIFRAMSNTLGL